MHSTAELTDELLADIPGGIGGLTEDEEDEEDINYLLPKTGREMDRDSPSTVGGGGRGGMGSL
jgi:hypothetical protein